MECLFIVKKRNSSYGVSYGLLNSAVFIVNHLNNIKVESKIIEVIDANDIDRAVFEVNPRMVFIEALFCPPGKLREIINLPHHKHRIWVIRIHSKIPFLATEGIAIKWIKEYSELGKNVIVAPNSEELALDINHSVYLPNIYTPKLYNNLTTEHKKEQNVINIGCFGAIRLLKNTLIQAIAAIKFGNLLKKNIHFNINGDIIEDQGNPVLSNLKALFEGSNHKLITHNWSNHENFINLIKRMDLGLQVSFSESFNIVAADFVYSNIPIVVSPDIEWMPEENMADPNSTNDIMDVMVKIYEHHKNSTEPLTYLMAHNYSASRIWKKFLKEKGINI